MSPVLAGPAGSAFQRLLRPASLRADFCVPWLKTLSDVAYIAAPAPVL